MPTVKSYLNTKDYERLKLRCEMRGITEYRYLKEAILHALEQTKKQGIDYLLENDKKKKKDWMTRMPIIELES